MKFCTNCGTKLNDDDLFCYNCGTKCPPMKEEAPKVEEEKKPALKIPPTQDPSLEEKRKEEEARKLAEAKRLEEERLAKEEAEKKAKEEAERKAKEEARLAEERKAKETVLKDIEEARAEKAKEKAKLLEEDAYLREEERKLREELDLPIKEEPIEEEPLRKEPVKEEKAVVVSIPKGPKTFLVNEDEFHSPNLLFHAVVFFAGLVLISLIYWLIGAFTGIHVAVRVIMFFLAIGTFVLPTIELVKLVIYMIKNRKINLFVVIILGIIHVLAWVFISLNFSAIF